MNFLSNQLLFLVDAAVIYSSKYTGGDIDKNTIC